MVVNEDGMKLAVTGVEDAIAYKFVSNPTKIADLDELYDALEVNKGTNVKYLVICNPGGQGKASDMTL